MSFVFTIAAKRMRLNKMECVSTWLAKQVAAYLPKSVLSAKLAHLSLPPSHQYVPRAVSPNHLLDTSNCLVLPWGGGCRTTLVLDGPAHHSLAVQLSMRRKPLSHHTPRIVHIMVWIQNSGFTAPKNTIISATLLSISCSFSSFCTDAPWLRETLNTTSIRPFVPVQ